MPASQNLDGTTATTLSALGLTRDDLCPEDRSYFDAMTAFDRRIERILAENGGEVICPRCKRPTLGWPLKRRDLCNIPGAMYCMRDPEVVLADIARREAVKAARAGRK